MKKTILIIVSLLCLGVLDSLSQTLKVEGVIIDEIGEPVIGATIVVEGTTKGVASDLDGYYSLEGINQGEKLIISYIGYRTIEHIVVSSRNDFVLVPSSEVLQEFVVTGIGGNQDKRMFTGATDRIEAAEVLLDGVSEVSRSLEGRAAGVSVQNVSGTFGAAPKIRVRGATSIFGDSQPLWVVDGVIIENVVNVDANSLSSGDATTLISSAISGLNANDIESFQILKDGSATSIYGARGMAGVIVITTKKGTSGEARVNYSGEYTMRLVPSYSEFNIMNSQDQMEVYQEMYEKGWLNYTGTVFRSEGGVYSKMSQLMNTYDPITGRYMVENSVDGRNRYLRQAEMRNTDWFDVLFHPSVQQNHSVSVSSGSSKGSYYASVSALVDPGWSIQSNVNRYTALLNASHELFENKLTLNIIGNASYREQLAPGSLSSEIDPVYGTVKRDFDINPYSYALRTSRTLDPNEFYTRNYAPFNIVDELSKNYIDINVVDTKFQAELKWKIRKNLEVTLLGAIKYQASSTEHNVKEGANQAEAYRAMGNRVIRDSNPYLYDNPDLPVEPKYSILPYGGIYIRNDYRAQSSDIRSTISYNTVFNDINILNLFGAVEVNALDRKSTNFQGWGLQYNMGETPFYILDMFKKQLENGTQYYSMSNTRERHLAFVGTGSYSYDYRYTINGTLRYEGSNRLGRSRSARWLPTWNIAGKWAIEEEEFFMNLEPTLSSLSLRMSYSLTADRGPSWVNNSTVSIYPTTPWRGDVDYNESGLRVSSPENSELTYEKKHEFNVGFDMGFLDDRISLSMDAYKRNNFDLIGNVVTMGLGGFVNKMGNVASMKSRGVELSLYTKNIDNQDFKWSTNFIFSHMDNEVTELETTVSIFQYITGSGYSIVGKPRGSIFSLQFMGLDDMGIPTFLAKDGSITSTNHNYQDTYGFDHLKYEGPADPTITGSLGNTFGYKNFSLNVFFTYSFGNVVRLDPIFSNYYSDLRAMPNEFKNRYVVPGDEDVTNVPVIASTRQNHSINNLNMAYSAYNYSDVRIAKGDFIRLKDISLTYNFPKSIVSNLSLSNLSLKLQGTNLILLYSDKKLQGQDPEFLNAGGVAVPMPKQLTLTCNIGF